MSSEYPDKTPFKAGLQLLGRPLLPLVRLVHLLYLTGPFTRIEEVLAQLHDPLDTAGVHYPDPGRLLAPHLANLRLLEELKHPGAKGGGPIILDEQGKALGPMEALELRASQAVLEAELEAINSLLCTPCGCSLCCTGPGEEMKQLFFEIPLAAEEAALMNLKVVDTPASRARDSHSEPPLGHPGTPFYQGEAAIYHWRSGWSLILPRHRRCPQLADHGGCRIYPRRPQVCRRPQIFAYLLEAAEPPKSQEAPKAPKAKESQLPATDPQPVYRARHKLLAVWDCPYVRALQEEIAFFAETSGLEPIFRTNKD